jgi:hypothetical protein
VEFYRKQNLEEKMMRESYRERILILNNDFKYSVAFVGVFAIDERPKFI